MWRRQVDEATPQGVNAEDAVESEPSNSAPTMSQLLSGVEQVYEQIESMLADATRSRATLHWAEMQLVVRPPRSDDSRTICYFETLHVQRAMFVPKNSAHFERYVSGIFDN